MTANSSAWNQEILNEIMYTPKLHMNGNIYNRHPPICTKFKPVHTPSPAAADSANRNTKYFLLRAFMHSIIPNTNICKNRYSKPGKYNTIPSSPYSPSTSRLPCARRTSIPLFDPTNRVKSCKNAFFLWRLTVSSASPTNTLFPSILVT